ncbi:TPA: hypothetical protein QCU24_003326 [Bacillus cereus]|uniref:hypothetical protein n=1 Tax=Bacillus cereus TaxID=1396 RepID=UPI0033021611|nr:hypothetical protein [Bacillus cereus]HDR6245573.1 hypothetical protein [Bacillus cereus]
MELIFKGKLDREYMYRVIKQVNIYGIKSLTTINLSKMKFADPYGMIMLLHLIEQAPNIDLLILPEYQTLTYMKRSMFFKHIREEISFSQDIEDDDYDRLKNPGNKTLLDITKMNGKEDIIKAVKYVHDQTNNILINDLGYTTEDIGKFSVLLAENLDNIRRHSESFGYICAQSYKFRRSNNKYIKVCISDTGIGIKNSFINTNVEKIPSNGLSDGAALKLAVIDEQSSKVWKGERGGNGFYGIKQIIKKLKGYLIIKSGTAQIVVDKNQYKINNNLPFFPGTQIEIFLPCK